MRGSVTIYEKEAWVNILTYNLVRRLMAQAAHEKNIVPRRLSFTGALRILEIYKPLWSHCAKKHFAQLYLDMLEAIAKQRIPIRPGRREPRLVKTKTIDF